MEYTLRFLFNFLSEIAISNVCKLKLFKNLTGCVIFIQLQKILLFKFSVELEFIHDDLYHFLLMNTLDFRPSSSKVANNGRYYQNYQSIAARTATKQRWNRSGWFKVTHFAFRLGGLCRSRGCDVKTPPVVTQLIGMNQEFRMPVNYLPAKFG